MSLFKYMFDNDMMQRADIERLRSDRKSEGRKRRRVDADQNKRIEELEDEVEELELVTQALVELLIESGALDSEKLHATIHRTRKREEEAEKAQAEAEERARRAKAPTPRRRRRG